MNEPTTLPEGPNGQPDLREFVTVELADEPVAGPVLPTPQNQPLARGKPFLPGLELLEELGRSTAGVVTYRGRQRLVGRSVLVKVVSYADDLRLHARSSLRYEIELVGQLHHPGITPVYEVGERDGFLYAVEEYSENGLLTKRVAEGPMEPAEAARLVEAVARAAQHIHEKGHLHLGLSPATILLADDGTPRITDFGLARPRKDDSPPDVELWHGHPAYLAPEQVGGRTREISPATDVYSLGAVLYALLTGKPPFEAAREHEVLDQVLFEEPLPPSRRLRRRLPRDLEAICRKCLRKQPRQRYRSARDLADDLRRFLKNEPVLARPPGGFERFGKWLRRKPAVAIMTVVTVLALGVAAVAFLVALIAAASAPKSKYTTYRVQPQNDFWLQQRLNEAERRANDAEQRRLRAENQRNQAQAERNQAQASLNQTTGQLRLADYTLRLARAERDLTGDWVRAGQTLDECPGDLRGWEWNFLRRRCQRELATLRGHTGGVTALSWNPSGKLASVGQDGGIRLWRPGQASQGLTFNHKKAVHAVAFSADGNQLVTGDANGVASLFSTAGTEFKQLRLLGKRRPTPVFAVACRPDGQCAAAAGADRQVTVYETATGKEVLRFGKDGAADVRGLTFSPDGERIAATWASKEGDNLRHEVKVWEAATGKELLTLTGHTGPVTCVAFSPDSEHLAAGSATGQVRIWETVEGAKPLVLEGPKGEISAVAFSPDGKQLATGGQDRLVRLWETATGKYLGVVGAHPQAVTSVAFRPDGRYLASGSLDHTIKVWNLAVGAAMPRVLAGHKQPITGLAVSRDGARVATVAGTWTITRPLGGARQVDAKGEGEARIGMVSGAGEPVRIALPKGPATCVAWSPDSGRIAVGVWQTEARAAEIQFFDARTGQSVGPPLRGHTLPVTSLAFSPDGRFLASSSHDGTLRVWDVARGALEQQLGRDNFGRSVFLAAAFSPDSQRLAAVSHNGTLNSSQITVWSAPFWREDNNFFVQQSQVTALGFGANGHLYGAGTDGSLRRWGLGPNGLPPLTIRAHQGPIQALSLSGNRLLTGGQDGTVRFWDATSGRELLSLRDLGPVRGVGLAGGYLVTATGIEVKVWDGRPPELRAANRLPP